MRPAPLIDPEVLAGYERQGLHRASTLWHEIAAHPADRTAVVCPRAGSVTYGALRAEAEGLAAAWHADGLEPGEVVLVQLPNWYEAVLAHLALTRLGAVTLMLLPSYREHELRFIAERSGAVGIICAPGHRAAPDAALYDRLVHELPGLRWSLAVDDPGVLRARSTRGDVSRLPPPPDPDELTILLATSGTTGEPKLVMHTHRSTVGGVLQSVGAAMGLSGDDVMLMPSPVAHATGLQYGIRMAAALGATLVLQDAWSAVTAAELVEAHGATFMMGATPFLFDMLALAPEDLHRLRTLRLFVCGGATIPESLAREAAATLPNVSFMSAWGMSETGIVTLVRADDPGERWAESDGRAVPGWEVRIVDPVDGRELPAGAEGEIACRGAALFHGYLGREDFTAQAAGDGWMHSGDLGRCDADGYLRCLGRIKDLIVRGGLNISAVEVEDAVRQHPRVSDVAVVGAPDPRLGERICAFVVPHGEPPTVADLAAFLLDLGFSKTKLPERIEALPELPTNAAGKVQKFVLLERLGATAG